MSFQQTAGESWPGCREVSHSPAGNLLLKTWTCAVAPNLSTTQLCIFIFQLTDQLQIQQISQFIFFWLGNAAKVCYITARLSVACTQKPQTSQVDTATLRAFWEQTWASAKGSSRILFKLKVLQVANGFSISKVLSWDNSLFSTFYWLNSFTFVRIHTHLDTYWRL